MCRHVSAFIICGCDYSSPRLAAGPNTLGHERQRHEAVLQLGPSEIPIEIEWADKQLTVRDRHLIVWASLQWPTRASLIQDVELAMRARYENVMHIRSLSGESLAIISGANLRHAKLQYANLVSADLRYADLLHADLEGTNLQDEQLTGARKEN